MANGIYALAEPYGEGGTLSLSGEVDVKTEDNTDIWGMLGERFEKFMDEPVYGKYEEHKKEITFGWGIAAALIVGAVAVAACVVTGGLAAPLVVLGSATVVGGISAGINYGTQKLTSDGPVDWSQVAIAGFGGAISGAVAASPLGVGGQMAVNGLISGTQSLTQGGSEADILLSTFAGAAAGRLGGAGPSWRDTNVFIAREVTKGVGVMSYKQCYTEVQRAAVSFKNVWSGIHGLYLNPQFSGLIKGFAKGTAASNVIINTENIVGFIKKVWKKYRPEYLNE